MQIWCKVTDIFCKMQVSSPQIPFFFIVSSSFFFILDKYAYLCRRKKKARTSR